MTQEEREKRNAYNRQYYELNLERERKKGIEKYHRNKKSIYELSEEQKEKKRTQRRLAQKIHYWKVRGIILNREELKKNDISAKKIRKIDSMKKFKLPSRITTKYVIEILRHYPNHRLWDLLISKWVLTDFMEFEELEKKIK